MKKKGFLCGFLCGTLCFGISTAYATGELTAILSPQSVYVDSVKTNLEAYSINGNNYVKLREIGKVVDFSVQYNKEKNAVEIFSNESYGSQELQEPQNEQPREEQSKNKEPSTKEDQSVKNNEVRIVRLPTDGSPYVPKVGD